MAGGPGGSSGFWSTPSRLAHNAFSAPSQPRAGGSGDVTYSYSHAGLASSVFPLSLSSTSRDRSVSGAMVPPLSLTAGSLPSSMPCSSGLEWNSSSARSEPHYSSLPAIDGGQAGLSTPRREPYRPWAQADPAYEPVSPPNNEVSVVDSGAPVGADSEPLDPDSLPSLLRFLGGVDPNLVSARPIRSGVLSEPESLARAGKLVEEDLVASQSPLLADILAITSSEISGKEATEDGAEFRSPGPRPLKQGQFLPSSKKLRAYSKPSPPLAPGALPLSVLKLSDSDRAILPSHEGKSNVNISATLPDKVLADWEETMRTGMENASLAERLTTVLYRDCRGVYVQTLSSQQREALLLASSSCLRATLTCLARSHANVVLARRDAVLAKAKSRLPSAEKDTLRALPLDGSALFGKGVTDSPFLQPPSETCLAMREVAKALAPKKQAGGQNPNHQRGQKRRFHTNPNEKSPSKKKKVFGKSASQGKKPSASATKPKSKSGPHPQ